MKQFFAILNTFLDSLDDRSVGFGIFLGWFSYWITSGSEILWAYLDDRRKQKKENGE